jgi:hypothetical protein
MIGNGLPRLRALARTTIIERFNKIAVDAADVPASINTVRCLIWAADHFLLPMRTMRTNQARVHSFQIEMNYLNGAPSTVCVASHFSFLNRSRSDKAMCRWWFLARPGGHERA